MKKNLLRLSVLLLLIYSSYIIYCELRYGDVFVWNYLSEIEGALMFSGINTVITTVLLFISAYNFLLCIMSYNPKWPIHKSKLPFVCSQLTIFLYLGLDERFSFHEPIGRIFNFNDAYILGLVGLMQVSLLYYFKEHLFVNTLKSYSLYLGGFFFGLMLLIDAFAPLEGFLRVSSEDLFKTWGVFFLFIYSLEFYNKWIALRLKSYQELEN